MKENLHSVGLSVLYNWGHATKGGSDVKFWGYIHGENGYLTADCPKKDKVCKIAVKESNSSNNQLWRTMNGKIISKVQKKDDQNQIKKTYLQKILQGFQIENFQTSSFNCGFWRNCGGNGSKYWWKPVLDFGEN